MTWMLTSTGRTVDLRFIGAEMICIEDIAHHLAQINRFTGACLRPYSVAEHSLLVVQILEDHMGITHPSALLAALLHDAHEAYTADLSTPMKQAVGAGWHAIELQVQHAVQRNFAISVASQAHADIIKRADLTALSTERAQLLPPDGPPWACTHMHPPITSIHLADRHAFTWQDWRQAYVDKFMELDALRRGEI